MKKILFLLLIFPVTIYAESLEEWRKVILTPLPAWSSEAFLILSIWQWMGIAGAILLGFIIQRIVYYTMKLIHKIASSKTQTEWDDKIILAFTGPTGFLFAVGIWSISVYILALPAPLTNFLYQAFRIIAGIALIVLSYKLVIVLSDFLRTITSKTKSDLDDQLMPIVERTLKSLVVIIGSLIILQNLGINVFSALAGLGIGGLAFALAAKDTAANLFGSFTIFMDQPFKIGDWVKINESHEGIVESIGLRTTRIRTFQKTLISLPNAVVANSSIENISSRPVRRVLAKLGVTYGTTAKKIETFVKEIRSIIEEHEKATTEGMQVSFVEYGAFSLDIMVYFYIKVADWTEELQAKQDVYLAIMNKAEELEIEFAFPTQTIHLESQSNN